MSWPGPPPKAPLAANGPSVQGSERRRESREIEMPAAGLILVLISFVSAVGVFVGTRPSALRQEREKKVPYRLQLGRLHSLTARLTHGWHFDGRSSRPATCGDLHLHASAGHFPNAAEAVEVWYSPSPTSENCNSLLLFPAMPATSRVASNNGHVIQRSSCVCPQRWVSSAKTLQSAQPRMNQL